jgi:hypothetical protein
MKTKNEIVDRLYKAGHITLEEVLVLMEKEVKYIPKSDPFTRPWRNPIQPLNPLPDYIGTPWWIVTSDLTPKIGENSCLISQQLRNGDNNK